MPLKPKKRLRRIRNNSERVRQPTRDDPDALAIPPSVHAMPRSDLQLARMLLDGFVDEGHQGKLRSKYLKRGEPLELEARAAMARLLRSKGPLDAQLRQHLADLFDPTAAWQARKIEFVGRRKGGKTDHVRNTQIASHIWDQVKRGVRVTKAIGNAANRFALSEDSIKKIWNIYRPHTADLG
jgi:hypothetical protein